MKKYILSSFLIASTALASEVKIELSGNITHSFDILD